MLLTKHRSLISNQLTRVRNPLIQSLRMGRPAFLILVFSMVASGLNAQVFKADTGHAEVKGTNGMSSYTGVSDQLRGTINLKKQSANFHLPLKTLKTGISMRDRHMRSTLETDKYPEAHFKGKIISEFPKPGNSSQVTVNGVFTIHGETHPIQVAGKVTQKNQKIRVKASFPLNITDYGMERPGFWFAKVNDKHTITINITLSQLNP